MKVSYNWLNEYLNFSVSQDEISNILTSTGLEVEGIFELFSSKKGGKYYYDGGWNSKAFIAWVIAGIFSIATVWHPALAWMGGYAWIVGAALGAFLQYLMSNKG